MTNVHGDSWEQLEALLLGGNREAIQAYLVGLPSGEPARALSRLSPPSRQMLLDLLDAEDAADLLTELPEAQSAELLEGMTPERATDVMACLHSDVRADLLARLSTEKANALLTRLPPDIKESVRLLVQYPPDTAGGLMSTEFLAFPDSARVEDIIADLRANAKAYARFQVQYAYLTALSGVLVGVLRLRDLLLAPTDTPARSVMVPEPHGVNTAASLDELAWFFDRHPFFGAPVTNDEGKLLGVVLRADVEEALGNRAERRFLILSGVFGGEEYRSMPWGLRLRRRLGWLGVSLLLNLFAAGVIGLYQDTLATVIALAVFLPVISGMGGNSGNQAMAVSIRELALGLLRPNEFRWVLLKEAGIGLLNGVFLGAVLAGVALAWSGNGYLALVVGLAMTLSMALAVCLGGVLPLALHRLRLDPAIAAGPILTTVTDTCGFFFALALASGASNLMSS